MTLVEQTPWTLEEQTIGTREEPMGELQEPREEEHDADLEEAMDQTMGDYEEP